MTRDEEHALKMNFIRGIQAPSQPKRRNPLKGMRRELNGRINTTERESLELAVHPKHVEAARDLTKALGLTGIGFRSDGMCIVSDESHAREYAKRTTPES